MKHTLILSRCSFLALVPVILVLSTFGQNPPISRGVELLAITANECLERGQGALLAEGYTFIDRFNLFGKKNIHTAGILCDPGPNGRMLVNIIVATNNTNESLAGIERVNLQRRMQKGSAPSTGGGSSGSTKITWTTQADGWRGKNGQRYKLACPANGTISNRLWGTNIYTDDSSICTAAVHVGMITRAAGGVVTVEIRAGSSSYAGSMKNGVTSNAYAEWHGSFVFVR